MRLFGLLGKNIDYSFSRKYFSEKFEAEEIDAKYVNFDIASIDQFPEILKKNQPVTGMNVTIPYKQEVMQFLNELDENAEKIGAVNTIKFGKDGHLKGFNTDYIGFTEALKPHLQRHHDRALILGTGGASKAVAYALQKLDIEYQFVSRSPKPEQLSYIDLTSAVISENKLIINSTPLGTFPKTNAAPPLPLETITSEHLLFDLIYNPSETLLMKQFSERGAKAINGYKMLVFQAEAAWKIWNDLQ